jgi:endonuclease VIII
MPEGDTIHRAARRMQAAIGGREMALADAPNPRSPVHRHAKELAGRTLELAEARGKHLLAHFSGDLVLHSHLGMNGRWWITADGRLPYGKPWLRLSSGRGIASQNGGKILRIVSESKLRNDPSLRRLGPDPLRPGFDAEVAAQRLRSGASMREIGDALLDQELIAGLGNVIRVEALFRARVSPWRRVSDLTDEELLAVVAESKDVMDISMAKGRRPTAIYKAHRRGCPNCGGPVSSRGQGDDNRTAFWCPRCQT